MNIKGFEIEIKRIFPSMPDFIKEFISYIYNFPKEKSNVYITKWLEISNNYNLEKEYKNYVINLIEKYEKRGLFENIKIKIKLKILSEYINVESSPNFARILCENWEITNRLIKIGINGGGIYYLDELYRSGFPVIENWSLIIECIKLNGSIYSLGELYRSGFPVIENWSLIIEYMKSMKSIKSMDCIGDINLLYYKSHFSISKETIPLIIEYIKSGANNCSYLIILCEFHFPISKETIPLIIEYTKSGGDFYVLGELYYYDFPISKETTPLIIEYTKKSYNDISDLIKLCEYGLITGQTIPYIIKLIESVKENLRLVMTALIEIISIGYLLINFEDFKEWVEFITKMVGTSRIKAGSLIKISLLKKYKNLNLRHFIFFMMRNQPKDIFNFIDKIENLDFINQPSFIGLNNLLQKTTYFVLLNRANNLNYIFESLSLKSDGYSIVDKFFLYLLKFQNRDVNKIFSKFRATEDEILIFIEKENKSEIDWKRYNEKLMKIDVALTREEINALSVLLGIKTKDYIQSILGISPEMINLNLDSDTKNAIAIYETSRYNKSLGRGLLLAYNNKNTYPFNKGLDAFPYNLPENIDFIEKMKFRGINMNMWINGLVIDFKPVYTDLLQQKQKTIEEYKAQAIIILNKMGFNTNEQNIFEVLKSDELKSFIKSNLENEHIADLRVQINYIKSLEGETEHILNIKKIRIYVERNPIKVLQMGNLVGGSCLATKAGNSWSTIANACDINKKVLYAVDDEGNMLGRKLIAMTNTGEIVQFRTYNNFQNLDLDYLFESFILKFSKECNAKLSNVGEVKRLTSERWYDDGIKNFEYVHN